MRLISKRVRGMQDILPRESEKWEYVENILKKKAKLYGFRLIRTPVLEPTNIFKRAAGETSDVVEKEMYTFLDKSGRDVCLRPEGTASVLRAVLENGLHADNLPLKLMYISPCYRYEKPQSGRYREFYQFGMEVFGAKSALTDAEVICSFYSMCEELGLKNINVEVNTVGCKHCRAEYDKKIREYFNAQKSDLCQNCNSRLERNPIRIFDCKNDKCKIICKDAPLMLSYICKSCAEHFEQFTENLSSYKIDYKVNPYIVRGLDYYTKTAFEFVVNQDDGPLTLCGGGRYDDLSKMFGGPDMCGVGLGVGLERLIMIMESQQLGYSRDKDIKVCVVTMDKELESKSIELAQRLRNIDVVVYQDLVGRRIKSQIGYADKIGCDYCIFVGKREIENNVVKVKNMSDGHEQDVHIDENLENYFINIRRNYDG